MTTPKPQTKAPARKQSVAEASAPMDTPAPKDALAGLPPMPKTKPQPKSPTAGRVDDGVPVVTKKELFARVKARTGKVKGHEVRVVMDVLLDELGGALVNGETLKLPALGTMKVQRRKPQDKADVVVCKLNRKKPGARTKDPLAKPASGS